MNTAIPIRPLSSTIRGLLPFESADGYRYEYVPAVRTEPPAALRFEHEVARFQLIVGPQRDVARLAIITKLHTADDPDEYLRTAVRALLSSARPGRLDDAVDVLSECGQLVAQFIYEMLLQQETDDVDEDFWYVLIRSVGKSTLPSARMFVQLLWSKSPEAAVEAFGDIRDNESLKRLHEVAASDPSDFIRQLAAEIIEECSE